MATMSITRDIVLTPEDLKKIKQSKPTELLKEALAEIEAKRPKVTLSPNWVEKCVSK